MTRLRRPDRVAEFLEVPLESILRVREAARAIASLDQPLRGKDDVGLGDVLPAEGGELVEEVDVSLRQETLRQALVALPEVERQVLERRYDLDGEEGPKSVDEISHRLGLTPEEIRRIEAEALERLAMEREIAALRED